jgi:hypothetical protein
MRPNRMPACHFVAMIVSVPKLLMTLVTAESKPVRMEPTPMMVPVPMMTPSTVRNARILWARMA